MALIDTGNPESRILKRPPANVNGHVGAQIGRMLDVQTTYIIIRFPRKPFMMWFPKAKALGFVVDLKATASASCFEELEQSGKRLNAAANAFARFMGREIVGKAKTYDFSEHPARNWYRIGNLVRTDYESDKFGTKTIQYTHEHGPGVWLYAYGPENNDGEPVFWMIRGGRLRITKDGIEG